MLQNIQVFCFNIFLNKWDEEPKGLHGDSAWAIANSMCCRLHPVIYVYILFDHSNYRWMKKGNASAFLVFIRF